MTEYLENEWLPYALSTASGKSFLMRGNSEADWFELDSMTAGKIRINGSPISEENALDMASELSVPEPAQISHETIDKAEEQGPSAPAKAKTSSISKSIIDNVVNDLRDIPANLSGDDSPLADAWEEIKDQVQHERADSWPVYVETMEVVIEGNVEALSEEDREILAEELDVEPDVSEELCRMMMGELLNKASNEKISYAPFDFTYFRYPVEGFDVYAQILERTGLYQFRIVGYSVAVPDGEEG
ncbi:MAG: hypothetical protein HN416_16775, partial [Nitrospina sp.]|nr:hypothetical protein [Nitrospina sp.]